MRDLKKQAKPNQVKSSQAKSQTKTQTKQNQLSKDKNKTTLPRKPTLEEEEKASPANINNCCGTNWTEPLPRLFCHL